MGEQRKWAVLRTTVNPSMVKIGHRIVITHMGGAVHATVAHVKPSPTGVGLATCLCDRRATQDDLDDFAQGRR